MKLIINCGELEFINFKKAIKRLEYEYGYQGEAWDIVVKTNDLKELYKFLIDDNIDAEII